MLLWWCSAVVALAGYGDAFDGLPTHADRETFLWTNAVRADPEAFESEYPCRFGSFAASEQTPKALLRLDDGLAEAAAFHSDDMRANGELDHDSSDGTPWDRRIYRYYDGNTIGENIAWGYDSPYSAVIEGWMCSSGHRSNMMSGNFNELGTGVSGEYYTQDFGRGNIPNRGMGIGIHLPSEPRQDAQLYVDFDASVVPDELYAVVDGARVDLALALGTDTRGVWGATVPAGSGCQPYYFVATSGTYEETWPEEGSYGWGDCAWDDAEARWLAAQIPLPEEATTPTTTTGGTTTEPTDGTTTGGPTTAGTTTGGPAPVESGEPEVAGCGCATGASPALAPVVPLLLALRRRRSRAR